MPNPPHTIVMEMDTCGFLPEDWDTAEFVEGDFTSRCRKPGAYRSVSACNRLSTLLCLEHAAHVRACAICLPVLESISNA